VSDRILLIASAPTSDERHGAWARHDDTAEPISAEVAERLRHAGRGAVRVRRGPERAALVTAEALGLDATVDESLRAWSMGSWAGRRIAEVAADDPARFEAWRQDPAVAPPGGETLLALLDRTSTWLQDATPGGRRGVVVTSASVVRAFVVAALDAAPDVFWRLDVAALSVSVLTRHDRVWRVRTVGAAKI
jgi:broad specificity phosphatase PhoE